jgi:RNA polymerase subunit RPABC4/transcription elongation factor Spt4
MAIKKCRECGREISEDAKACPYCGCRKPTEPGGGYYSAAGLALAGAIIAGAPDMLRGWIEETFPISATKLAWVLVGTALLLFYIGYRQHGPESVRQFAQRWRANARRIFGRRSGAEPQPPEPPPAPQQSPMGESDLTYRQIVICHSCHKPHRSEAEACPFCGAVRGTGQNE